MRIERAVAELVARAAIAEPYRQIEVMTTHDFARWLRDRDIRLSWDTLHHLWLVGVLHPIAVLEPALSAKGLSLERFAEVDLGYETRTYVDLGTDVDVPRPPETHHERSARLSDSLLWHPFQLWSFIWLARLLRPPIALDASLSGPDPYAQLAHRLVGELPAKLSEHANSDGETSFLRVLAVLLAAEPPVHLSLDPTLVTHPTAGESSRGYFAWRDSYDGAAILSKVGLSLDDVEKWHNDIAVQAQLADPLQSWRVLIRHARREMRRRLKGPALQADTLYDTAEVLRRYLDRYHGRELPEEDDALHGPQGAAVKQRLYGSPRTADFDRAVFRRIVRGFDLDPQPRTTWFIEGHTEEAFIRQFAGQQGIDLSRVGVELMNLRGLGGLASDRLRDLLERFRREEVFPYISIDMDGSAEGPRLLRHYARDQLLPAGFRVWEPDFESANFTADELAGVAEDMARDHGVSVSISGEDIRREMAASRSGGKAIEAIWRRGKFYRGKGQTWGTYLANYAAEHECPPALADGDGRRPVVGRLFFLLRGQRSVYQSTVEDSEVNDEGELAPRADRP